ncbi:hypothetical protein AMAG_07361 [Allomyces macrogynus ATCC 38327]|uniref:Extracellular membrane protein CFEM domain-containing protein n=1 Tax=Allomyces macrogynus (strain ATCC 38327) TaxID=578462 RepID=A0A0L0SI33_ALLM3|nr:hypothetical protein AMAG_07361 [Allomyces macrogynus ATCC 38327]|eukprot:KNE62114.1 hypothetical protein AMAG_07361 [Allomyces macrogynus ATCC 38327]
MKSTAFFAVATLAIVAATSTTAQVVDPNAAPTLSDCAGMSVFQRCWGDVTQERSTQCVPGESGYNACMCATSGGYRKCFDQCLDSPDHDYALKPVINEQSAYCMQVTTKSTTTSKSTSTSSTKTTSTSSTTTTSSATTTTTSASTTATSTSTTSTIKPAMATDSSAGAAAAGPAAMVAAVFGGLMAAM